MFSFRLNGGSRVALAAGVMLATVTIAQAALAPAPTFPYSTPDVQTVGCALGAHIGPLGACIGGEHRDYHRDHRDYHRDHRDCWTNDRGERVCR